MINSTYFRAMAAKILVKEGVEKTSFWISNQELSIIEATTEGKTSKEIAQERGLSFRTVESHRRNAMKRLHCRNVSQLVMLLSREKILI